jgi:phage/plasmid-like protein (TIGR03299 family)
MAHELTMNEGTAEMAYAGDTPWHGLGQKVPAGASIEQMQEAAGLLWTIERAPTLFRAPISHVDGDGAVKITPTIQEKSDTHILYRSDNLKPLSVVSSRYNVVQPHDVLEFFRDLIQCSGFQLETAGSLRDGRRIWALARISEDCTILEADKVGGYLLLATSCDAGMATTAFFTPIRVVCQNTIRAAFDSSTDKVAVPHNTIFKPDFVKAKLGLAQSAFDRFLAEAKRLAAREINTYEADQIIGGAVQSLAGQMPAGWDARKTRQYQAMMALFNGAGKGAELPEAAGTAWGALNAVTEYYDWHATSRTQEARINNAWFGNGASVKAIAFEEAMKVAA